MGRIKGKPDLRVSNDKYRENYDKIFSKKKDTKEQDEYTLGHCKKCDYLWCKCDEKKKQEASELAMPMPIR